MTQPTVNLSNAVNLANAVHVEGAVSAVRSALAGRTVTDVEVLAHVPDERLVFRCSAGGTRVLVRCVERDAAHRQFRYLEALSSARCSVLRVPGPIAIAPLHDGDPVRTADPLDAGGHSSAGRPSSDDIGRAIDGAGEHGPAFAVLVLEHLDGTACTQLVGAGAGTHRAGLAAMTLAGRALAELHAIDLTGDPAAEHPLDTTGLPSLPGLLDVLEVANARENLRDLVRPRPDVLAAAVPGRADLIERAVRHVLSASTVALADSSDGSGRVAVLHRDVHLRQMFVRDDRLGLVDWDLAAIGDPAFDVAYLTTHLATHVDRPDELIRAVLDGYGDDSMTPERLAPYRSFNLLRRACRRFRLRDAGWEAELQRMLSMLADTLDEAGVSGSPGAAA